MTFWMSTADWMELQAYRATGLTPEAVQEMVSFPYTADDEEVTKMIANQCVACGAEMPEGDQVCKACRAGDSKSAITKITTIAEFLANWRKTNGGRTGRGGADVERGQGMTSKQAREDE